MTDNREAITPSMLSDAKRTLRDTIDAGAQEAPDRATVDTLRVGSRSLRFGKSVVFEVLNPYPFEGESSTNNQVYVASIIDKGHRIAEISIDGLVARGLSDDRVDVSDDTVFAFTRQINIT